MVRDTARSFARDRLAPHAAEWDRESRYPKEALDAMGPLGLLGMLSPAEWDGAGCDNLSYALAIEELAAGDGGTSTIVAVQNLSQAAIARFGSDEQRERFLRPMARGEAIGAFMLTEPEAGSDAARLRTRARLDGNKYVLNGTKQFVTSGKNADLAVVFAVTDEAAGKQGISAFVMPTGTPGYQVTAVERKLGQRCSDTCQVVLEDCEVPPDQMLGEPGDGYRIALSNLEGGRIGIAAQSTGLARAAYEASLAYARERRTFGKPIAQHQAIAFKLADMATEIEAARLLAHNAARRRDAGVPCLKEASMAKLFASEMAERVCSAAIQIHGGYGYVADFPVERYYRDARVCQIYEGTSEVQRLVISRALLNA